MPPGRDPTSTTRPNERDSASPSLAPMPTVLSIYEDSEGEVRVARMRLANMGRLFPGKVGEVLARGEVRMEDTLQGVVERPLTPRLPLPMRICPMCRFAVALNGAMA